MTSSGHQPGPRDVVVVRSALAVLLNAPESARPWMRFDSYDAAVAHGRALARSQGVDLWVLDREALGLVPRSRLET